MSLLLAIVSIINILIAVFLSFFLVNTTWIPIKYLFKDLYNETIIGNPETEGFLGAINIQLDWGFGVNSQSRLFGYMMLQLCKHYTGITHDFDPVSTA